MVCCILAISMAYFGVVSVTYNLHSASDVHAITQDGTFRKTMATWTREMKQEDSNSGSGVWPIYILINCVTL